jgi:hypothetical protein
LPDDDPIVGLKLVALCNNKSPFVVFDGFSLYLFCSHNEMASLKFNKLYYVSSAVLVYIQVDINVQFIVTNEIWVM